MNVDLSAVISDLEAEHQRIGNALAAMRELQNGGAKPQIVTASAKPKAAKKVYKPRKIEKIFTEGSPKLSITDAIRQAVREAPRTSVEVADRVEHLIPGVNRESVGQLISQRMKAGEFRKDDALKVHFVNGGMR